VADEAKQFCPKCEKLELSDNRLTREDLEQLSRIVSKRLKADWKFKGQIFGAVLLVVLAVIGVIDAVVGFNLKQNMAEHFENQEKQAKKKIDDHLGSVDEDIKKSLAQADSQMRSNIARNFEATNVQVIIENVAKAEAKGILEAEVRPAVDSFREDAGFIRTVARAQAYDFKAYQWLLNIGKQTNDNAKLANQVVAEIDRSLLRDRSQFAPRRTYMTFSRTNFYYGPFASDELAMSFSSSAHDPTSFNREGFVNTVGDLKQPLFLHSLIEMFTNETDLAVADRLTIAVSHLAREDFHPHDFERIQTWWHSHKNDYTNWPFSEFDHGCDALSKGSFREGAKSFQHVLNLDPSADVSRALAITCYLETGDTNKSAELSKGFKPPTARWAQWASAMADLETGSVSNATVKFANLTKSNPMMIILPHEGDSFWRRLDWPLFYKLTSAEKP